MVVVIVFLDVQSVVATFVQFVVMRHVQSVSEKIRQIHGHLVANSPVLKEDVKEHVHVINVFVVILRQNYSSLPELV